MSTEPRIIAALVKSTLDTIGQIDADTLDRVRVAVDPATLERIEQASRIAWIPVELDVELTERFFDVAGSEQACRVFRDTLAQSFHTPLLRPLVDGAVRLFGRDVHRAMRWVPKGWSLIYRDCGEMTVSCEEENAVRLEIVGAAPAIARSPSYLEGIGAALSALFDLWHEAGAFEVGASDPAAGRVSFDARW